MTEIYSAYDKSFVRANINDENLLGIYTASLPEAVPDGSAEVIRAMDSPVNSLPLEKLACGKPDAVIIASDHTRPVPSKAIIPEMLRRLRQGNPDIKITILIATGCHRETSRGELISKFGSEIVENEHIVIHDAHDENMLISIGTLPSGGELRINKLAAEASLLVAEGFIEPHFFAGFSGGRKSVLPGISAARSVMANHCAEFINHPCSRTGVLEGNPIHQDMLYAAGCAKLAFIVNVVINSEKQIVRAFAGETFAAHRAGCEFLRSKCAVSVPEADIVVTSNGGYPLDQNVYQSVKGMTAAEAVCRENGVIIITAACSDGHGGEAFYETLKNAASPRKLLEDISRIPRNATQPDQWQYQIFARILDRFKVIMVTTHCDHRMLEEMKITAVSSLDEALEKAFAITGKDAKVAVLPDGVSVIAEKSSDK